MADAKTGQFVPGKSGNPSGRPRKRVERRDGWINTASGHGTAYDRRTLTRFGCEVITDLEAMQLWRSEWLCARVIETRPREAFRRGYDVKCDDKHLAEQICGKAEELRLDDAVVKAAQFQRAYGGAAIFPVIEGAVDDLRTPRDNIGITNVVALHVLEPRQLNPFSYYGDISHPKFGQPEIWQFVPLMGRGTSSQIQMIHESRLVIFPGTRVSMQTQPGQRIGWGDSSLSKCRSAIADYGLTWGSAATIVHNFGRDVLQLEGWADLAAQEGTDAIMARRISSFEMASSALRLGIVDAKDKLTPRGGSLAGLDSLLVQQAQYVAAACNMPVTVLMGMSPAGLNATGDMDVRNWYATIENDQTTLYKSRVEQLYKLLFLSTKGPTGGKEPPVWSITFRPLMTPTEQEQAATRLAIAQTDQIYADMRAVSPEDIAESRWKGDTYSSEMVIDWVARAARLEEEDLRRTEDALLKRAVMEPVDETVEEDAPKTPEAELDA